ncbi:MAG: hypothetical protein WCE75_16595, partial [Terracidiphilus sp.]
ATAATGGRSPALKLAASSFLAGSGPVAQNFVWQAQPAANNTAAPGANLALLFGAGAGAPAATGLSIAPNGVITFSPNQTFPIKGTGGGTITGVTAGTGLKGGGTSGNVTLSVDPAKAPLLSTFNTFASGASFGGESWWNGNSGDWMMVVTNTATSAKGVILGQAQGSVTAIEGASPGGEAISGLTTTGTAVAGQAYGEGSAAYFWSQATKNPAVIIHADGSASDGLDVRSIGGNGVAATSTNGNGLTATSGNGFAGLFTNNSTYQPTVYAVNNGPGNAGYFASSGPGRVSLAGVNSSTSSNAVATYGSVANGKAVYGAAPAGIGIYGTTSTGTGVSGIADTGIGVSAFTNTGTGVAVTSTGGLSTGVLVNAAWTGVHAMQDGGAWTGSRVGGPPALWGDSGSSAGLALAATGGDTTAAVVMNNSAGSVALNVFNYSSGGAIKSNFSALAAGTPDGICGVGGAGSLTCTGPVKSLVATSDARQVETYAVQSAENWMEDYGSGQLAAGRAAVRIDQAFAKVINAGVEYHVFLTPNGDCKGLYVDHKTAEGFQVHELGGGVSQIAFDYKIVAKRTGHEAERLHDVTESFQREMKGLENSRLRPEAPAVLGPRK